MKLLIASDIHGSFSCLEKLIERFIIERADKLVLLGDILYHGPRNSLPDMYEPKKVIDKLNALKSNIIAIRGNCDTEVDQMVLQFPLFADYSYIYDDGRILFLTHGHLFNKENCPPLNKGDVFLSGHTHIPVFEEENEVYFVNPGSVSIPKNGSCNSYVIYEDKEFLFKDLDGNIYSKKRIQI